MNKASPVEMRKALELVNSLKGAGILFVPIPVLNDTDLAALRFMVRKRLEKIEAMCDGCKDKA